MSEHRSSNAATSTPSNTDNRPDIDPASAEAVDRQLVELLARRRDLARSESKIAYIGGGGEKSPKERLQHCVDIGREFGLPDRLVSNIFHQLLDNEINNDKAPVRLSSRDHKPLDTVIEVKGARIGADELIIIGGPCAVESYDQIMRCAEEVKDSGAHILRGGCFKARTSPYAFQGLGYVGLDYLAEAGQKFGIPVITEVMSSDMVGPVAEKVDIIQIGARNMQNFTLLKSVGECNRPVMLKRGMSSSIEELLLAAEYILVQGNPNVILCERGIRTFETSTRNTLDISAVPVLKARTHLPIVVDPSHAAGERSLVPPLTMASKAVGAHGVMIEFHPDPDRALSDAPQALSISQFRALVANLAIRRQFISA